MRTTTLVRALPALVVLSGCVAILDVDTEGYQDIDEAVCTCYDLKSLCEGIIQTFVKVSAYERVIRECVTSKRTCNQLDECLKDGGLCTPPGAACEPIDPGSNTLQFQCCTGECTDSRKCPDENACKDLTQACGGDAGACCADLVCGDESTCCRDIGGECDPLDGSSPCCDFGEGVICAEDTRQCTACVDNGFSCANEPCCQGFRCPTDLPADAQFCLPLDE